MGNPFEQPHSDDSHDEMHLRQLLHRAVDDVQPADARAQILRRVRFGDAEPIDLDEHRRRRWAAPLAGAAAAVAATIAVAGLAGAPLSDPGQPDGASHVAGQPVDSAHAVAVYYPTSTPDGYRLGREYHPRVEDPIEGAVTALQSEPIGEEYAQVWPTGSIADVRVDRSGSAPVLRVELTAKGERQYTNLGAKDAPMALQSLIYTLQGAVQSRMPVQFVSDGEPATRVLGVEVGERPQQALSWERTLAPVSISDPADAEVSGESLPVRGMASSRVSQRVRVSLRNDTEEQVFRWLRPKAADGEQYLTFEGALPLANVPEGDYTLLVVDERSGYSASREVRVVR